jgi:hypothetical protein
MKMWLKKPGGKLPLYSLFFFQRALLIFDLKHVSRNIPSSTNLRADNDSEAHEVLQCRKNALPFFEIGNVLQLRRNT